jgi:hypothetical protein
MRIQRIAAVFTAINLILLLATLAQARAAAQTTSPVLRGRALELVDERGQVRGRLNVESNGEVVFRLLDQRGTIRVKLGASEEALDSCLPTTRQNRGYTSWPTQTAAACDWPIRMGASGSLRPRAKEKGARVGAL